MKFKSKLVIVGMMMALFLLMAQVSVFAETKEVMAEGTYVMGDGETPTIAEERALLQAKRSAVEQAGTYVQSFSRVKNYQLTEDEVVVLASGVMEVQVVDKKRTINGNGIEFWVKIKATVDSDKIQEMAAKVKDKENMDDYKKLQEENARDEQLIAQLKQQLQQATAEDDKRQIKVKLNEAESSFSAQYWYSQGKRHELNGAYHAAINAYSKAISLRSNYGQAYFKRGAVYAAVGQYEQALADYDSVLSLSNHFTMAYYAKGRIYELLGQRHNAIRAYRTFIDLAPPNSEQHVQQAKHRIRVLYREH